MQASPQVQLPPTPSTSRALGATVWGRRVARLPDRGTLLVCTDLQGNLRDYEAMRRIYLREEALGHDPILAFCGDMVHGPSPDLHEVGAWPPYLGTPYEDASAELICDFERWSQEARTFSLLGNHEHAHIGGPIVAKFYDDEAAVLDDTLGPQRPRIHEFLNEFPLVAVAPCGVVLTHGAPAATEPSVEAFERLTYNGYRRVPIYRMLQTSTLGALLWSRAASSEQAKRLLSALGHPSGFVCFGHDVVPAGYEKLGTEQICVSTSFGIFDSCKTYLRLDLAQRYQSVDDLRDGIEILALFP